MPKNDGHLDFGNIDSILLMKYSILIANEENFSYFHWIELVSCLNLNNHLNIHSSQMPIYDEIIKKNSLFDPQ